MKEELEMHSAIKSYDGTYKVAWDSRCEICKKGWRHIDIMDNATKKDIMKLGIHLKKTLAQTIKT